MKRAAPWVLTVATLAYAGCGGYIVETVPGPGYEQAPPPAYADGQVYVASQPPPPAAEYPPPAPGPGYNWVSGYWDWTGNDWYWVGGNWTPARPGFFYVAPRYVVIGGRPVYERGYWHDHSGRRDYQFGRPAYRDAPQAGRPGFYGNPGPAHRAGAVYGSPQPSTAHEAGGVFGAAHGPQPSTAHEAGGVFGAAHNNPPPSVSHGIQGGAAQAAPPPAASHPVWRGAGAATPPPSAPAASSPVQSGMLRARPPAAAPAPAPQPRFSPAASGRPSPRPASPIRKGVEKAR